MIWVDATALKEFTKSKQKEYFEYGQMLKFYASAVCDSNARFFYLDDQVGEIREMSTKKIVRLIKKTEPKAKYFQNLYFFLPKLKTKILDYASSRVGLSRLALVIPYIWLKQCFVLIRATSTLCKNIRFTIRQDLQSEFIRFSQKYTKRKQIRQEGIRATIVHSSLPASNAYGIIWQKTDVLIFFSEVYPIVDPFSFNKLKGLQSFQTIVISGVAPEHFAYGEGVKLLGEYSTHSFIQNAWLADKILYTQKLNSAFEHPFTKAAGVVVTKNQIDIENEIYAQVVSAVTKEKK